MEDPLPPEICAQSDPPPFQQHNLDLYLFIAPKLYEPRAFQRAIDEPCSLPLTPPKGGTKRDFAIFSSKFQLLRKKSATKFLCVKTSSGKVVATLFLYLTVHGWIAGDVPIYLKFALK